MEKRKINKYFLNNLLPGDFVQFSFGQRYKILTSGQAFPVCKTVGCKKQAQEWVFQNSNVFSLFFVNHP